jgi:hypothetical protein
MPGPSLLMDPGPLPVSSHGSSSSVRPCLSGPVSLLRLFSWTHFRCLSLLTDPVSLLRLFSWTQFLCPSLPTDPALLSGLIFQAQFHCSVSSHGPNSVACLFSWTQFLCPSLLTDPVSLLRLFLRTQLRCSVLYFRPSSVTPSLFTDPVQCPVHLSVLFHPVPSDPVQFFVAIRTCLPLLSGRSVVSTQMCACCSCDLAVSILFVKTYY